MSYTSTYELFKTKVNRIRKHQIGNGSGVAMWDYVSQKVSGKRFNFLDMDWECWKSEKLSKEERVVLLSTYDRSYIEVERLPEFAVACHNVHELIISNTNWDWSHFFEIGNDAKSLSESSDYRCLGFAIGVTSCEDLWWSSSNIKTLEPVGVYGLIEGLETLVR